MSGQTIHVAFIYRVPIHPPGEDEPRKYKAGKCLGAYIDYDVARKRVESEVGHLTIGDLKWKRVRDAEDPDCWFFISGAKTFYGYVETIVLERRDGADRRFV